MLAESAAFTIVLSTPKMNRLGQQMARTSIRCRRLSSGCEEAADGIDRILGA
jgi:hypothetical protein